MGCAVQGPEFTVSTINTEKTEFAYKKNITQKMPFFQI